jgi:large subunit ribosomal protein L35
VLSDTDRLHFDVRGFTAQHGLDGSTGGGAHMWRQVWDEGVSEIYATVLGMFPYSVADLPILYPPPGREEPKFAVPPKPDRYADIRGIRRYVK